MSPNSDLCHDIVIGILDNVFSKSSPPPTKPTFSSNKRSAEESAKPQNDKKLRIEAYEDEITSLLEKNSKLESQLHLMTQNLSTSLDMEARSKDHWRRCTQAVRKELEKVRDENKDLLMRHLENQEICHQQSDVCMTILGDILKVVWSLSKSPDCLRFLSGTRQPLSFTHLSTHILAQLLEKEEGQNYSFEYDLASGVLGSLVNFTSSQALMTSSLYGSEELTCLVESVVSYLDNSQDQRILRLGFMLLDNVLRSSFRYSRRESVMSEAVRVCLNQVLTRWIQDEGVTAVLKDICERLYLIANSPILPVVGVDNSRLNTVELEDSRSNTVELENNRPNRVEVEQ